MHAHAHASSVCRCNISLYINIKVLKNANERTCVQHDPLSHLAHSKVRQHGGPANRTLGPLAHRGAPLAKALVSAWHEEMRALLRHAHDAESFVVASRRGDRGDGRGGSSWPRRRNAASQGRRWGDGEHTFGAATAIAAGWGRCWVGSKQTRNAATATPATPAAT